MTTINLRKFFYWYKVDEYIEVSDEVAAELMADKRFEFNCWRQAKRNKANYSLDAEDGIENSICEFEPSPEEFLARAVTIQRLCCALNHLPPFQGRRIDAHFLLGLSVEEIAREEGVSCRAVQISIDRGLEKMRKIFKKTFCSLFRFCSKVALVYRERFFPSLHKRSGRTWG